MKQIMEAAFMQGDHDLVLQAYCEILDYFVFAGYYGLFHAWSGVYSIDRIRQLSGIEYWNNPYLYKD